MFGAPKGGSVGVERAPVVVRGRYRSRSPHPGPQGRAVKAGLAASPPPGQVIMRELWFSCPTLAGPPSWVSHPVRAAAKYQVRSKRPFSQVCVCLGFGCFIAPFPCYFECVHIVKSPLGGLVCLHINWVYVCVNACLAHVCVQACISLLGHGERHSGTWCIIDLLSRVAHVDPPPHTHRPSGPQR